MRHKSKLVLALVSTLIISHAYALPTSTADALPSWNDGAIKQSIISFVTKVTDQSNRSYVAPENRIATFDNDGTLWVEQPLYTQFIFALARVQELAPKHPEWKTEKPFSIVLSGDKKAIATLSVNDFHKIMAVTHSGMSIEEFDATVKKWMATAENQHFKQRYTSLIYQPMLEVMEYLRQNGFTIYIVTGGGQDFVRSFAPSTYKVSLEHIIGTAGKTKYTYINAKPTLIKTPDILFIDDKTGKPEAINLFIGKKPIIAFGNSDGDREMLEWTESNAQEHMMYLVHHDDSAREFSYGAESKIGTFSDALMAEAKGHKWGVISMKNDWKVIFPVVAK